MLKGLGELGDMAKMMKTAQEMKNKMAAMQEDLRQMEVSGEAGPHLVTVSANGKGDVTGIEINPAILVASEQQLVEDLILAAIQEAQGKAAMRSQSELARISEEIGLPAGMKLPF
ncbi:MAG: DNA-binding YbaB/EbfC family protein [Paracoccaceae bacterium]|jgi:DNA-binding YbaB/EbfC family protein